LFSKIIDCITDRRGEFAGDLAELERHLESFVLANGCSRILASFVLGKGKRIRAILFFSHFNNGHDCWSVDAGVKYKTISIVEAIHFASIMHDDVVDNGAFRRNGQSFFSTHGTKASILLGDLVVIRAIDEFLRLHATDRIVRSIFIRECRATAYGAALEQQITSSSTLQEYVRTAALKTGAFFKLSCFLGSYLGIGDFALAKRAAISGLCFGVVFQAQNDLDCYRFERFNDSEDYMQGSISFPIIVMRDHFGFDPTELATPNQDSYDKIRELVFSKEFKKTAQNSLNKYTTALLY
jgi:geranylgeranyl pyrophosphate synthase